LATFTKGAAKAASTSPVFLRFYRKFNGLKRAFQASARLPAAPLLTSILARNQLI
jgi:hypothetical protein